MSKKLQDLTGGGTIKKTTPMAVVTPVTTTTTAKTTTPTNTDTSEEAKKSSATSNTASKSNVSPVVAQSVKNKIDESVYEQNRVKGYTDTTEYQEAYAKVQSALDSLKNIDTSRLDDITNQIRNRGSFSYDASKDQLFQNAMATAMKSGQIAMADTMGQASALTGGYGSSYATQASASAYANVINNTLEQLPEYYRLNLDAYNQQGEELRAMYSMEKDLVDTQKNDILNEYNMAQDELQFGYNDYWSKVGQENTLRQEAYQKERNAIDDARYEDEKTYNREQDALNNAFREKEFEHTVNMDNENLQLKKDSLALDKWQAQDNSSRGWASLNHSIEQDAISNSLKAQQLEASAKQQEWENAYAETSLYVKNGYKQDASGNWVKDTDKDLKTNDANLPKVKQGAVEAFLSGGQTALDDYVNKYRGHYTEDTLNSIYDYVLGSPSTKDMQNIYDFSSGNLLGGVSTLKISGTDTELTKKDIDSLNVSDDVKKILKNLKEGQSYNPATNQIADVKNGKIIDATTGKVIQKINVAKKYK